MSHYFCKPNQEETTDHLFVQTKKFEQLGYARCGQRIYRVLRLNCDGTPVLRLFGNIKKEFICGIRPPHYEFHHAKEPKGRYAKDIDGKLTMKNYVPCKRGQWWLGAVTIKLN